MNNLKKALAKDDMKKYQKSKIEISKSKKTNQWADIETLIECHSPTHHLPHSSLPQKQAPSLQQSLKKVISRHLNHGQLEDLLTLRKTLISTYQQYHADESYDQDTALGRVLGLLEGMASEEESAVMQKGIILCVDKIESLGREKKEKEKEKCLDEYNKILKLLTPTKLNEKEKEMRANKKLAYSTSANNLHIKVTRQQYQLQQDQKLLQKKKKKSVDTVKNKSSKGSSESLKNLDAHHRLQQFLRDPSTNLKLIKTKIQYDYSAILQASKSKIHVRNRTMVDQKEKESIVKIAKQKKNQAFVFYRPKK